MAFPFALLALVVVAAVLVGAAVGTFTGLLPGVHVNTVAPLVLIAGVAVGTRFAGAGDDLAAVVALATALLILSVAVVHTIMNVIPTLAAPLPEEGTALMLLPVQRMAQQGQATEALRVSLMGSWMAAALAALLLVAVLLIAPHDAARLPRSATLLGVTGVLCLLLLRQPRPWHATGILLLSGLAGLVLLPRSFVGALGGDGTVLLPALAGLFGAPLLVLALIEAPAVGREPDAAGEPGERGTAPRVGAAAPLVGTGCGLLVALFPGLTSATAGAFGRALRRPRSDAEDVAMLSAVDTANVVGNTGALLAWGATRSGASAAAISGYPPIAAAGAGAVAALAIAVLLLASLFACRVALRWGPDLVARIRRVPPRGLAAGGLGLLVAIVLFASGVAGLLVALCLLPLGLLPHRWGAPRALLMGFLLVPFLASAFSAGPIV